ncbi:MAG: response regulator transcription factor [Chloroflexi bacterium]|nr:response regulator transcription factor [Chloroflexota bacterium]
MTTSQPRSEPDATAPAILVVEDDRRMAAFLDRALTYAGYRIVVAEDGEQALTCAEQQPPDLVLLDVMLPGISGLEVARRLRASSGIPILMLTAREGLDDRVEGLDAGADDYLAKPFALQELLARLRALLRGRALAVAESKRGLLSFADVLLDQDAREATRAGRRLTLRNKEFELLAYFLRHPGKMLEPRTLLEAVWGYPYLGDANLVHVTLRRLRQELESSGGARLVQTVPRGGYVLRQTDAADDAR